MPTPPFALRPWLALLLLSPSLAFAQTSTGSATLDTTLVTGNAVQEELPTTTRTDAKTLDERQIRSFDDLGKRAEPGVNYSRTSESINIRGLDRDRVLTTLDGIRVPWLTDGARSQGPTGGAQGGLDSIDFNGLSAVDIVRGANSSLVGSGALGGAVQLFTLNPEDLLSEGKDFGSLVKSDYDSADHSWGLNGVLAGRYQDTAWLLQAGQRQGHELESGGDANSYGTSRTEANPADTEQQSLLVKLQQRFDGGHKVGFTAELFERQNDIDSRTSQGSTYLIGENSTEEHNKRQRLSVDYAFQAEDDQGLIDSANAIVYWQKLRRHDDQNGVRAADSRAAVPDFLFFGLPGNPYKYPSGNFGRDNQIEKELYGVSGNLGKTLDIAGLPNKLTLGGELYQINTEQVSEGYDNCPGFSISPSHPMYMGPAACDFLHTNQADMPKAEGTQWALYATDEIAFADGRVKLTPGLRYDHYQLDPKATGDFANNINPANDQTLQASSDHKLSASLLATWQVAEEALLYAQWAQGFKAPDATQLYMNYGAEGSYLRLGNTDLKPEESNGYEIGAQLGNDKLGGSLSLFDNHYKNFIDDDVAMSAAELAAIGLSAADYPMGVTRTENRARVQIYGAEVAAHWEFVPHWKLWGSVAWANGEDLETNQRLSSVAPITSLLGLSYTRDQYGADLMLRAAAARDKVENAGDFEAPGYGVVDMTGWWQPAELKGVKFQAGLFNALDKQYWNALNVPTGTLAQPDDYYSEVGRNFRVSASWQY
ncbi:TonB-dependent hemoglobin/transferrin/lactoferrin family receptor [Aquipseudomonas alcaligenes]|uniref:Outer membrane heme receptor n=1 Tax=Aquipseudomonas alcaligenes TaxID=43263 RepID=A0AA37FK91_AQUAC|nr:TonB-dependent hemoglobin/transferrin/lactoferrin family receptor [Pseudomonas alcaligenes]BCR23525.1 outer membrane heme receptor [Pseudomonas alcaligenes]GIZ64976.1 outer membrane heme receptor [Pseudomonas alcaligenes]GIZ69699.1 outer membrane heme receptor [Pseudomonas alcaligenes]GIZ74051.1 outer membrane heme receptor [Pseudomonas alcaligenes]GIZ78412.1 outer membrane heme receptor [Pseudomonas alcaligenes]